MSTQTWLPTSIEVHTVQPLRVKSKERGWSKDVDHSFQMIGLPVYEQVGKIFQVNHAMITPHTLDTLFENIAYRAAELLQVDFSRLILKEPGGAFRCKASYQVFPNGNRNKIKRPEPLPAQMLYQKVLAQNVPVLVESFDNHLSTEDKKALGIKQNESLCLAPMVAGQKQIGVFIFGRKPKTKLDTFWEENLGLATITADQAANTIHMASLTHEIEKNRLETVLALSKAIDARDHYTSLHGKKITEYAVKLAKKFKLPHDEVQTLRYAALLHDIGKIGVPDHILYKPGPLTGEEWTVMKQHPVIGADIVLNVANLAKVAAIIHSHHERFDGSGYPDGLKGDEIPFSARILAVVDAYSVMMDQRVYQPTLTARQATEEIRRCSGSQFDPVVVEMFLTLVNE
jgi:putative nucleotidyltransferase with HDIG domain